MTLVAGEAIRARRRMMPASPAELSAQNGTMEAERGAQGAVK